MKRKKAVASEKKVVVKTVNEEIRILRIQTKKGRGTEGMKAAVARTEEFPRWKGGKRRGERKL